MSFNVEVAEQALGMIKAYPEKHDQSMWRCETGMCLAGWVAELTTQWVTNDIDAPGDVYEAVIDPEGVPIQEYYTPDAEDFLPDDVLPLLKQNVMVSTVAAYARRALGVDPVTAGVLFAGDNTAEDLEHFIKALSNGGRIKRYSTFSDRVAYCNHVAYDAEGYEVYWRAHTDRK